MNFDEIMREISQGLTGDADEDIKYLEFQMEKYKEHELSTEIIRACGRLMYEILPEDRKNEIDALICKENIGAEATLDEVRFNIYKGDLEKALSLMEPLAQKADKLIEDGMYADDSVSEYHNFNELYEEMLYTFYSNTEKTIRRPEISFDEIYLQYGSLLFEMKKYEEAKQVLTKALKWNPASARISFEYAETFKVTGDIEKFFSLSKGIFKYSFTRENLARCYRNLAYYFVEVKKWKEAAGCNLLSLHFQKDNRNAMSELYFIRQMTGEDFEEPTDEELESYSQEYGFPVGPDNDVIGLALTYSGQCLENNNIDVAIYLLEIAYQLTEDEEMKNVLDNLKNGESKA